MLGKTAPSNVRALAFHPSRRATGQVTNGETANVTTIKTAAAIASRRTAGACVLIQR
jgi:hypothetical protein